MTASLREAAQTLLCITDQVLVDMQAQDVMFEWQSVLNDALEALRAALALPVAEPVAGGQFFRECSEMADALKSEYGTVLRHHGVAYYDFKHHPYAGRAGVLLRRASKLGGHALVEQKPLTRKQVQDIVISVCDEIYPQEGGSYSEADAVFYGAFAHAIEAAHNIKAAP